MKIIRDFVISLFIVGIIIFSFLSLITNISNKNTNLSPAEKIAIKYDINSEQDLENLGQEITILSDAVRTGKLKLNNTK